jgi:hypothetical protein
LRRAAPLPQPPGKLLNGRGQLELFEDWLFNDNGKFQLREFASPQAQTIDCTRFVSCNARGEPGAALLRRGRARYNFPIPCAGSFRHGSRRPLTRGRGKSPIAAPPRHPRAPPA